MLHSIVLAASVGGAFVHPHPAPPADLPVAVYQQRRARLMAETGDCMAVIASQGEVNGTPLGIQSVHPLRGGH